MKITALQEYAVFMKNGQIDMVFRDGEDPDLGTPLERAKEVADFEDGDTIKWRTVFRASFETNWEPLP